MLVRVFHNFRKKNMSSKKYAFWFEVQFPCVLYIFSRNSYKGICHYTDTVDFQDFALINSYFLHFVG